MAAAGGAGEVRAVEVRADDPRAAGHVAVQLAAQVEEAQVLIHPGDGGGRQQARGAVAGVAAADGAERLGGAVHEVGPVAAVDVQVDEPGREVHAARGRSPVVGVRRPVARRRRSARPSTSSEAARARSRSGSTSVAFAKTVTAIASSPGLPRFMLARGVAPAAPGW